MARPTGLDIRSVIVLFHGDDLLLLQRGHWKKFAPNRWTGLGGKVEPGEESDLAESAWREVSEETDLQRDEVFDFRVRRFLIFSSPHEGPVCLVYVTGWTSTRRVPACNEGSLRWVRREDLGSLDIIENTARVLPFLIADSAAQDQSIHCGVATYDHAGTLQDITFPSVSSNVSN